MSSRVSEEERQRMVDAYLDWSADPDRPRTIKQIAEEDFARPYRNFIHHVNRAGVDTSGNRSGDDRRVLWERLDDIEERLDEIVALLTEGEE